VKLGLDAELIGIGWLIFSVWNALNDPIFGYIQDRTKTKLGRRIPYLRYGAPVYGILFIIIWFPFVDISNKVALFFYFELMLFSFDTIFTIVGLITYALPAEMAISSNERANLMVYSTLLGAIGYIVNFILPVLLLTGDVSTSINPDFLVTMIVLGITCAVIIFISSYFLKENKFTQLEESLGVIDAVKETFKNKPFLINEVSVFTLLVASTTLTTAIFYYVQYVLKLSGFMTMAPLLLIFLTIFVFTYIYGTKIIPRYGLKKVNIFGLVFSGLSFILLFLTGWAFDTAIPSLLLIGIGLSALMLTAPIIFADTVDYDETRTKKRRETTYSGIEALITKPAISIANWLFLLSIASFGFQPNSAIQTESAIFGIMLGFTIIPAVFVLFGALVMKFYPLDGSKWEAQKLELKKIHEQKEKEYLEYLKKQEKL
jgi:GPH family glycoside/pentoside/hexuronide:cation symporter